jgi:ABC-type dipeptide/oligopeptide/nickel transport system permease component
VLKYLLKRLLLLPVILLFLSMLIFSLVMFLSPYERLAVFIPNSEAIDASVPMDELVAKYGLDKPFYVQYADWLGEVLQGNLGWSPSARMPVGKALRLYFPATVELMLVGMLMVFPGSIFLGTMSARRHNKLFDQVSRVATTIGVSLPEFIFGLLLLVLFYGLLGILPPGQLSGWAEDIVYLGGFKRYTGFMLLDSLLNGNLAIFWDALKHMILPAAAYSIGLLSVMQRVVRSSLLETLKKDYVTTARAKGLLESVVVKKHARRNSLLPVITVSGGMIARMLGGAAIVETVFNYRGMGMFIVTAAQGLDFSGILGASLLIGIIIVVTNLIVDVLYTILDPTVVLE